MRLSDRRCDVSFAPDAGTRFRIQFDRSLAAPQSDFPPLGAAWRFAGGTTHGRCGAPSWCRSRRMAGRRLTVGPATRRQ